MDDLDLELDQIYHGEMAGIPYLYLKRTDDGRLDLIFKISEVFYDIENKPVGRRYISSILFEYRGITLELKTPKEVLGARNNFLHIDLEVDPLREYNVGPSIKSICKIIGRKTTHDFNFYYMVIDKNLSAGRRLISLFLSSVPRDDIFSEYSSMDLDNFKFIRGRF